MASHRAFRSRPPSIRRAEIAALGCLVPFALLALGALLGALIGETSGAYWGGGTGFVIGLAAMLFGLGWWERVRGSLK